MRNLWRIYIKPFDDLGSYAADWIDVSNDVDWKALGSIAQDLDNTEYDIGIYRNSNFKLQLNNSGGLYSDVGNQTSIFHYKRTDSLVRVTWQQGPMPVCGIAKTGQSTLTEEIDIFVGLLNDDSATMSIKTQKISFTVLGRESIFLRTIVPFGSISNGDLLSDVLYACLNQTKITTILTIDPANIEVGIDTEIDSIASLQNKTVQEGLNKLLLATNSVLYIEDDAVFIQPRTESVDFEYYFYGQASPNGPENVSLIENIKNGIARTFNFFTWKDTTNSVTNTDSSVKYGARKKEIDFEFITDTAKRDDIMEALLDEFGLPKQEFDLETPLNHQSIDIGLLAKVSVDYPTIYLGSNLPICGIAICGEAVLPIAKWDFRIDPLDGYKVIGRAINIKEATITFKLRAVE